MVADVVFLLNVLTALSPSLFSRSVKLELRFFYPPSLSCVFFSLSVCASIETRLFALFDCARHCSISAEVSEVSVCVCVSLYECVDYLLMAL